MTAKVLSSTLNGFNATIIEVECDIHNGMPAFTIVGLGDTSVQESKERIKAAIKNSGCDYPQTKKVVNLAPADLRKHGPLFDLPIALSILMRSGQIPKDSLEKTVVVGELALDGNVRSISGALAMSEAARNEGCTRIIVPRLNVHEAALVKGIECVGVSHLFEVIGILRGEISPTPASEIPLEPRESRTTQGPLLDDLDGHEVPKRALVIAAAGFHHLLMYGAPGAGKSTLAQVLGTLMPRLTDEQAMQTTKIYSIAGLLGNGVSLIDIPPFRTIHQSTPVTSLIGGGAHAQPGEISLAHNGVLFADELLEFPQTTLDMLRQPLETGTAVIARLSGSATFPARSLFVGATNPCPCGFWGDEEKRCTCLPSRRDKYLKKLSGPLLDRLDLVLHIPRLRMSSISSESQREKKKTARETIVALKKICIARAQQNRRGILNGWLTRSQAEEFCPRSSEAEDFLKQHFSRGLHSGRSLTRILKLSRTIADMQEREQIEVDDLKEAVGFSRLIGESTEFGG